MIYKTYRATNPVRWRDGDGWQVGWRLLRNDPTAKQLWRMSGTEGFAMVSVWGSPEPIFVSEDELEEMPMRVEERSTSLDAKPGTWESGVRFIDPCLPARVSQLDKARAEANDLMQRLTESQQEVAKLKKELESICSGCHEMEASRDQWRANAHSEQELARQKSRELEMIQPLLDQLAKEHSEAKQELAEVKAERDRLAAQVEALRKIDDAHKTYAAVVKLYR